MAEEVELDAPTLHEDDFDPALDATPVAEPEPEPVVAEPAPNVVLEYRQSPGSEQLPIYLPEMAVEIVSKVGRPFMLRYNGKCFTQSRQRGDGLWVYGSEG